MRSRSDALQKIEGSTFDVCVIGGGATGAGCAWDAQLRGLKTVLIEGGDFASATSSSSTKLVHGGVRYLQQAVADLDVWPGRRLKGTPAVVTTHGILLMGVIAAVTMLSVVKESWGHLGDWRNMWLASAALALVAAGGVVAIVPAESAPSATAAATSRGRYSTAFMILAAGYFLFGFGYIITATFLIDIVRGSPAMATNVRSTPASTCLPDTSANRVPFGRRTIARCSRMLWWNHIVRFSASMVLARLRAATCG